ncbi:MAG TPA: ABC transporter permease, partial [Pseudacidobacterium sp.]|nr:ABC transporter permease [Pseudacidobacterium sp.]
TPGFTLTAILTLALGIGVNAAMFSVMDQVLLRPLPYPNAQRLVLMGAVRQQGGFAAVSLPDMKDWQARNHTFQAIGYFESNPVTLRFGDSSNVTTQVMTSTNLFELLGVHPAMGRSFTAEDGKSGRSNIIIVTDRIWRNYLHSDPNILGKAVFINGDPYTVIGVLPPAVGFPGDGLESIYAPVNPDDNGLSDRSSSALLAIGLLRPGVTVEQAGHEINSIHQQLLREYPKDESTALIRVVNYRDALTENSRSAIFALYGAIIAVWLIACANVAGLMLTRTNNRRREIAIRGALGAGRDRLVQQFLTESLLISLAGGAAGAGFAAIALGLLKHYFAHTLLYGGFIHINGAVCAFLLLASCISALLFGVVPAWMAANTPLQEGLREGTAAAGVSRKQAFWRDASVVAEITLTLALLIAAGLMMRTLYQLRRAEKGFIADQVVTGMLFMPTHGAWWTSPDPEKAANLVKMFYRPLQEKLLHTPGISGVGFTTVRPLEPGWDFVDNIIVNGRPKPNKSEQPTAQLRGTDEGYFRVFGIRLLKGRYFDSQDTPDSPVVAVVNQSFVKEVFPREDPIGKQIEIADAPGPRHWATIVGVAEDVRQRSMGEAPVPELDLNLMQFSPKDEMYPIISSFMNIAVRTNLPAADSERIIANAIHDVMPDIALQNFKPMPQVVDDSMGNQTLAARLLGIFGIAALAIAIAGIYGLLSYSVSQRMREFGVRLALGSPRGAVIWLVLRHALLLLAVGIAAGITIAIAASGVMRAFIYGFHGYDVLTVFAVALVLAACALLASYLPARKAARVDPVVALRTE